MRAIGQSVVPAVQTRAQTHGVTTRGEVRMGEIETEIVRLTRETEATVVVLGYPEKDHADEQHAAEEVGLETGRRRADTNRRTRGAGASARTDR